MRCLSSPKGSMTRADARCAGRRLLLLAVCALFIAATLLAAVFVAGHLGHTHDRQGLEGSCRTCARLASASAVLKSYFLALGGTGLVLWGRRFAGAVAQLIPLPLPPATLVHLKIRLNN
jgi:hypothetical protein